MENDYSYLIFKRCLDKELDNCMEVLPLIKEYLNKKYWVKINGEIFLEYTDGTFFMNSGDFIFIKTIFGLNKEKMIENVKKWVEEELKLPTKTVLPINYVKK